MVAGVIAHRVLGGFLRPAASLLSRLRYAQKFTAIGLVLMVPLGLVAGAYIALQRDQIAFSAKERSGVVMLAPLIDLAAALVEARHGAAIGESVTIEIGPRVEHIETLDRRLNPKLGTGGAWQATRRAILIVQRTGSNAPAERRLAYDNAVDAVLALIVRVGDASNLTLDPDIDSYYLMDTLQFRLPLLLDVAGRGADAAAVADIAAAGGGTDADAAMNLGLNFGVITDIRKALNRASYAVVNQTADADVRSAARSGYDRLDAAAGALEDALGAAMTGGRFAAVAAPATLMRHEAAAFADGVATALDRLLRIRITGFTNRALRVGLGSSAAALLAVYLFAGFYLSVTRPVRRIVDVLDAVAHGDLARRVSVDSRDELGFVSRALNDTIARTEVATGRLSTRATQDPLTRLPNRAYVLSRLTEALDRCAAAKDALMGVIFIDLDRFKIINDSLGHEAGDEVLCEIASRLSAVNRDGDVVARLAGDEFVVICENLPSVDAAVSIAERFVTLVSEPLQVSAACGREVSVGASVGIALADGSRRPEPGDLLRDADVAMYQAKQRGRGRVEIFDDMLRVSVQHRLQTRTELRHGIDAGEIYVYYQPIVTVGSAWVVGFEALARWHHPVRGVLTADEFIDVAEESGLILPLGVEVLRQACRQAADWRTAHPSLQMNVNVSGAQFGDASFVDTVAAVLADTGLDPDALWLEITETTVMADAAAARETLDRVRALGVHLALDDFGTGYSSLAYLRSFPVHALKIDGSFISGVGGDTGDEAIVSMIVALAGTLGLTVVAEGVENRVQFDRLGPLGCDTAQGYLFGRPAPPAAARFGKTVDLHPGAYV